MAPVIAAKRATVDVPVYKIQIVSALTGIPAKRIRRWESKHHLLRPLRTKGGHRLYSSLDVKLLRDIRRLVEEEGLSLQAVKAWLEAQQPKPATS